MDRVAQAGIGQAINSGSQEIEKLAPQIIKRAIEGVHKTPFRLLGNLGRKKFAQVKRKILSAIKRK